MKRGQTYYQSKPKALNTKLIIITILVVVVLVAIYLSLTQESVQLAPGTATTLGLENAKSILKAIDVEKDKKLEDFLCGKTKSYTDPKGNTYGPKERDEFWKALAANSKELRILQKEIGCRHRIGTYKSPKQASSPTTTTQTKTTQTQPQPRAAASASASGTPR